MLTQAHFWLEFAIDVDGVLVVVRSGKKALLHWPEKEGFAVEATQHKKLFRAMSNFSFATKWVITVMAVSKSPVASWLTVSWINKNEFLIRLTR